jgi:type III secretion protein W
VAIDGTLRAEVQAFTAKQGVDVPLAEAQRQAGLFQGQKVEVRDTASAVADAAEEVSFAASEKVEKSLSERKAGSKEALKSKATDLAEAYVNQMAEPQAGRKLHALLDQLKKLGNQATEAEIRQAVGEHFGDAADQFAALSFAGEALAQDGNLAELRAKLNRVKADLLRDAGPAIRSGLNIAAEALSYAGRGLEGAAALRDLYRFSILGGQSVSSIYLAVMNRYGAEKFADSLEFLLRAASSDLDGRVMASSMERPQLKNAMDDIYHVQALGNTYRSLDLLLEKTRQLAAA